VSIDTEPFLSGNFAPVFDEHDTGALPVTGQIPTALRGAYLRNGSNPQFSPLGRYHWFDGDGMIHGITLEDGTARYRNRWVRTTGLEEERKAGHALFGGLSNFTFPDAELFAKMGGPFKNAANTHVVRHAEKILALWEGGFPHELTAELETVGLWDFGDKLVGPMTAHPKIDPATGEMLFFGYSQFPPYLRFHVVDAAGDLVRSEEIDIPAGVMMHDFVITDQHALFLDAPAVFDLDAVMTGGSAITWKPENGCRIGVLPRAGSAADVTWYEVDPCFVFHFMNASTDGERITIDAARHSRMAMPGDLVTDDAEYPSLARFTIDTVRGFASWEQLDDRPIEFPRINDHRAGLAHRYGYCPSMPTGPDAEVGVFDRLVRYDLQTGATTEHDLGPGRSVGEAVFAPDPDGSAEDDGWLLSFVYDAADDRTDFVILDARDLAADPVATVRLPARVPHGFHGSWLPA
jgi:carotenoid cleavage dioxygenase